MTTFIEGRQQFDFHDEDWKVSKLDDESYYKRKGKSVQNRRSVDFVAVHRSGTFFFIEVKDHRYIEKKQDKDGELREEFVHKVHDSIATIVGGTRMAGAGKTNWKHLAKTMVLSEQPIRAILWQEGPNRLSPLVLKSRKSTMQKELIKKLHWLTNNANIRLVDSSNYAASIPDLTVTHAINKRQ